MKIQSHASVNETIGLFDDEVIKSQPMLHRATREFALEHGGWIADRFLETLPRSWSNILIDSRVHMLMPGMYPCIPGWHHDDVPREREDGQPEYSDPSYRAQHCLAVFGDCSLTEFALGEHEIEIPPVGTKIYKELSPLVEQHCAEGKLTRWTVPEGKLVYFDWLSWHRGVEAHKRGFRYFIRATRYSKLEPRNEIRVNANVYMPVLDEGW